MNPLWSLKSLIVQVFCLSFIVFSNTAISAPDKAAKSIKLGQPSADVVLEINGKLNNPNKDGSAVFDMEMLKKLPVHELSTSTLVTEGIHNFKGFLMRDLLEQVQAYGKNINTAALNDYVVKIDIKDFYDFDVIVAYEMDGQQLHPSDKGPLWIVYPREDHKELQDIRYDYRWVWQLYKIDID